MGWIYLAAADGLPKPSPLGCGPSPTVKTTSSLNACCFHACLGEKYHKPQSGMTLELFEPDLCRCQSTSSTEVSPVRGIPLQVLVAAWRIAGRNYSGKLSGWRRKRNQRSFFSKMSGLGLEGLSQRSELRLSALASSAGTVSYRHPMLGFRTEDPDGFFSDIPTPTVKGNYNKKGLSRSSGDGLATWWTKVLLLPTPCVKEGGYNRGGGAGRTGKIRYSLSQMWSRGLIPTPTKRADLKRNSPPLPALWKETTGTQLPASFVEWIMASRIGASALESWAIPSRGFNTAKRSKRSQNLGRGQHGDHLERRLQAPAETAEET